VSVFTKRNAIVGFLALKALKRRRRTKGRGRAKLLTLVVLGVISAGVLAGLAAVLMRRLGHAGEAEEAAPAAGEAEESEIVGEFVTTSLEPIPAT